MVAEMKAIRVEQFGEPEVMQLVEVLDPQISAGQVLVQIHAAGVNPVETYIRAGNLRTKTATALHAGHRWRRHRFSRRAGCG